MDRIERLWCPRCEAWRRATNPSLTHLLHALLSVGTLGIWLLVWFVLEQRRKFHCDECGTVAVFVMEGEDPPKLEVK